MILELDTMIRLLGVGGEDTLPDTGEQGHGQHISMCLIILLVNRP